MSKSKRNKDEVFCLDDDDDDDDFTLGKKKTNKANKRPKSDKDKGATVKDDGENSTDQDTRKSKRERLSLDDKKFERELQKAMELSKVDDKPTEVKASPANSQATIILEENLEGNVQKQKSKNKLESDDDIQVISDKTNKLDKTNDKSDDTVTKKPEKKVEEKKNQNDDKKVSKTEKKPAKKKAAKSLDSDESEDDYENDMNSGDDDSDFDVKKSKNKAKTSKTTTTTTTTNTQKKKSPKTSTKKTKEENNAVANATPTNANENHVDSNNTKPEIADKPETPEAPVASTSTTETKKQEEKTKKPQTTTAKPTAKTNANKSAKTQGANESSNKKPEAAAKPTNIVNKSLTSVQAHDLSMSKLNNKNSPLGKIEIKSPSSVRVGLSRNSKVKPLHPNAKLTS